MKLDPFVGPRMKLARAKRLQVRLSSDIDDYRRNLRSRFIEGDGKVRIEISNELPIEISLDVGDIVHNLRTALDLVLNDLAVTKGDVDYKMQFPFAESETNFVRLSGRAAGYRKLGKPVVEAIAKLKPWKDGNDILWGLHELDIIDKHRLVQPVTSFLSVESLALSAASAAQKLNSTEIDDPSGPEKHYIWTVANQPCTDAFDAFLERQIAGAKPRTEGRQIQICHIIFAGPAERIRVSPGEVLMIPDGERPIDIYPLDRASLLITFPPDTPFSGCPLLETLSTITNTVEEVIEGLISLS